MRRWLWLVLLPLFLPAVAGMQVRRVPMYTGSGICGDSIRNGSDQCDDADLGGASCTSLGYASGTLACTVGCLYDTSSCVAAACNATSVTFWWRLEAVDFDATNGTDDYSTGDDVARLEEIGDDTQVEATSAKMGTNGLLIPVGANRYAEFDVASDDIINDSFGRVGMWVKWATAIGDGARLWTVRDAANSNQVRLVTSGTGGNIALQYRSGGSTATLLTTTTTPISAADTWYYVEAYWDGRPTDGSDTAGILVDGASVISSSSLSFTSLADAPVFFAVGNYGSTAWGGVVYIDQVIVSSDPTKDLSQCKDTVAYP